MLGYAANTTQHEADGCHRRDGMPRTMLSAAAIGRCHLREAVDTTCLCNAAVSARDRTCKMPLGRALSPRSTS